MKVLAIGAHPDDIEIFMFGLISICKQRGDDIYLAIATDGSAGNVLDFPHLSRIRKTETLEALKNLGTPHFFNFSDGKLAFTTSPIEHLKKYIYSIEPDLIITHAPEDYHPDHSTLSNFIKLAAGFMCPILYADTLMGVNFIPDYYIDITKVFMEKKKAILIHESQNPERFLNSTTLLNRFRSAQCNSSDGHYAEAFRFEKRFPYSDIRSLLPPSPGINQFYKSLSTSLI